MISNSNSPCTLAGNPSTLRRSFHRRTVWIGVSLTILFFLCALVASPTSQLDVRSIRRRELGPETFMFHYQSQGTSYGDWITLFTLCLAPIIAHLVAGVPAPGRLTQMGDAIISSSSRTNLLSHPLPPSASLDGSHLSLQPDLDPLALLCHLRPARPMSELDSI
jgi:hypothetical protein